MLILRKGRDRGFADHGWLKSWHSFSFAGYYDPRLMGFRALRVINQDIVAPGQGFPMHAHADMEIITVVLRGTIEHKDSMGHRERIRPGEIQRMSAGTGVQHSEYNPSSEEDLELLQIWIEPSTKGLRPSYQQASYDPSFSAQALQLLAAPVGVTAPVQIHQDVKLYRGTFSQPDSVPLHLAPERHAWLQLISGAMRVGDHELVAGDALAISRESLVTLSAMEAQTSLLIFYLA